jgi:predicted esterase
MEALADVMVNYPVDTTRIIIAGFSMGGYGAMRVFWQFPDVFRGVAVLSGHPNLATKWIGEGHPDFLQENFLDPFRDVPVFIYHSRNDLNCPFALVEQMTDRLGHAGAMLTVSISEMGGHGVMDETAAPLFRKWVNAFPAK